MKIAVTYENGQVFQHFGHTEQFKIYTVDDENILSSEIVNTDGTGHGALTDFLKERGVNVLICGGIGAGAVMALRDAGMAMELSSAGLRKACREIYPAPPIMALAAELGLPVSFASDAHGVDDVAHGFARLASYAKAFGFREHVFFDKGRMTTLPL